MGSALVSVSPTRPVWGSLQEDIRPADQPLIADVTDQSITV